ncbi:ABC transporter family protein [Clostridium argentinense CDC 2741]|uniref:ABC transporter family protein n=1 Tax=Clostridium argentinense CDC 2741 TaxID=1418104 RepID=A0A0C1U968_9CLOT|nr:ABC transporter ATP-binding protein [Clostridium argentinense]KIE48248.1 ABC transporter family protein [Clostridium argentinense CDC 2741]NFF41141.1 ABC transporter ATP-binding protein [Clostridium argentinense]NFP51579.1 ABC transporter ATP-binding protein [Clostridium argentinense]NFP74056.1 ABC transporter ATP-binding protein [Clostridium argentinense]
MEYCIKASKLSAGYNGILIFSDFNIEIPKGKITTLIGSNGSGKSTILKTLSRLIAPTEGVVCLEGKSIHSMPTKLVAQNLALLPQGAQIPSGITVADLVEYGRFPYRRKMSGIRLEDKKIIKWALSCTNMTEFADRKMDQLSGGQRQRGWIAMALAQKTKILFLDEPTTYLDISHQLETLNLLRQLNIEQGVTVVMVLHDLNHAIMFSDYLITIKEGKVHSTGSPEDVIIPQTIREVFDVEAEVIRHPILDVPVCLPYGVGGQVLDKRKEIKI